MKGGCQKQTSLVLAVSEIFFDHMHVESDIVGVHKGSPLGGKLPSLENSEAITRAAPFHNPLQILI